MKELKVVLKHYHYVGGQRDGEWGVNLEVDGVEDPIDFLDDGDALGYFISEYLDIPFKVNIERDYSRED